MGYQEPCCIQGAYLAEEFAQIWRNRIGQYRRLLYYVELDIFRNWKNSVASIVSLNLRLK